MSIEEITENAAVIDNSNSMNRLRNISQELEASPEEKASVPNISEEMQSAVQQLEKSNDLREKSPESASHEAGSDGKSTALSSLLESDSSNRVGTVEYQQKAVDSSGVTNNGQTNIYVTPQKRRTRVSYASCLQDDEKEMFISSFFVGISFQEGLFRADLSREIKVRFFSLCICCHRLTFEQ